ncbi:non-ribosomal peptide synthetase [Amycolatopsis sp. H6(2020)]|nr:non-ribosomal peptide synthetase [Amycolatopsis sp. H6(2020)]
MGHDIDETAGHPGPVLVPTLLARAAERHPNRAAAQDAARNLTYRELFEEVNVLASRLVAAGVRAEDRVVVRMRHTSALLVALLAVLRAGGAYVPVDEHYPPQRQQLLIEDSGARVMIVDHDADLPGETAVPVVLPVDGARPESVAVAHEPAPDDLACVIYTSGSTGAPKGVMITHRGLANLAHAASAEFGMHEHDRYLVLASVAFSASLEELFPPLVRGATAVFPPDRAALSVVAELLDFVADRAITLFELQTAHWHLLVRHLEETGRTLPESVRLLVVGGERALPELVRRWNAVGVPLVHVYGPTETTATATYQQIPAGEVPEQGRLPLGRAIAGTHVHVVDADLRPVASGTPGELLVGGASLARGYLGKPAATATCFVPDALSGAVGGVLYRTGDLVRIVPGEGLIFLDRIDKQVKVRGYRIEPAEVEAALHEHPDVREALVVAREDVPGQRRLVGYVSGPPENLGPGVLREFLRTRLPAYMVPSAFVRVDELPLTIHRKVDQAALPAPASPRPELTTDFVPPAGAVEREVAQMSADLLRLDAIGATDDFLELGGDSLFVLRLLTRIKARFGRQLGLAEVLAEHSVRGWARLIAGPSGPDGAAANSAAVQSGDAR